MAEPETLPILGQLPRERSDAARNRVALLEAAQRLVARDGADQVTMDAVAAAACVGKGTVFRRFESRAGLMAALLDHTEADFQAAVIAGPPPLGPGAPADERLLAFGHARLDHTVSHLALVQAAGRQGGRAYGAYSFHAMHVRLLLAELAVDGDIALLATAILAPLDAVILDQQTRIEEIPIERIRAGWDDLVARVLRR